MLPPNAVLLSANEQMDVALSNASRAIGAFLAFMAVAILVARWRRASAPLRRVIAPVLWTGGAAVAVGALALVNESLGSPLGDLSPVWSVAFAIVPFAFLAGLLRQRLARTSVAALVMELQDARSSDQVRVALARSLHDPDLRLAYWLPEEARYVDASGRPVELPSSGSMRSVRLVEAEGRPVAALLVDPSLQEEEELVQAVCAAAAFALENERLQAELRARLEELKASRARIVEAGDMERRRIERNLHDGTQQRLVSISMALGLAEARLTSDPDAAAGVIREARESLGEAATRAARAEPGHSPGLAHRAWARAGAARARLPRSGARSDRRRAGLPTAEQVEAAAYYLVAEALANVAKPTRRRRGRA